MQSKSGPASDGGGAGIQNLKDYMRKTDREPLIGLEWVLEYKIQGKRNEMITKYFCDICDLHCDLVYMIEHLSSLKHRKLTLTRSFPHILPPPPGSKEDRTMTLRRLAMVIEQTKGLQMFKSDPTVKKITMKHGKITWLDMPKVSPRPETVKRKQARWMKALEYLENFEIENDVDASTVTTLTQKLTNDLKEYSSKVKSNPRLTDNLARATEVAAAIMQGKTTEGLMPGPGLQGATNQPLKQGLQGAAVPLPSQVLQGITNQLLNQGLQGVTNQPPKLGLQGSTTQQPKLGFQGAATQPPKLGLQGAATQPPKLGLAGAQPPKLGLQGAATQPPKLGLQGAATQPPELGLQGAANQGHQQSTTHTPSQLPNQKWLQSIIHTPSQLPNQKWQQSTTQTPSQLPNQKWQQSTTQTPSQLPNQKWQQPPTQTSSQGFNQPNQGQEVPPLMFNKGIPGNMNLGFLGGPMGLPGGPMGLPGGPMGLPGGPMGLPSGPMGLPGGPMGMQGGPFGIHGGPMVGPVGMLGGPMGLLGGPMGMQGGAMGGPMGIQGGPLPTQMPWNNPSSLPPFSAFPQRPPVPLYPPPPFPPPGMVPDQGPKEPAAASGGESASDTGEDLKFFKKLMNLLSVIPEGGDAPAMASESAMIKSLFDEEPSSGNIPGDQPRSAPSVPSMDNVEDPAKLKILKLLASQDPAAIAQPEPSVMPMAPEKADVPPADEAQANQEKLLQILIESRKKSVKMDEEPLPEKQIIPDPARGPADKKPNAPVSKNPEPMALRDPPSDSRPRPYEDYPPEKMGDKAPLDKARRDPPRGERPAEPAPYTRISLSPSAPRPKNERLPDHDHGKRKRSPERRRPPHHPFDEGADWAPPERAPREMAPPERAPREMAPPERAPRERAPRERAPPEWAQREMAPPERAPRERASPEWAQRERAPRERAPRERGAPLREKRPREEATEADFFAPLPGERREKRPPQSSPNLSADILKRIRGKDMFTISAILSEYADSGP